MWHYRYGPGLAMLSFVAGLGLIFNSLRGMLNREGMYDSESTRVMSWANILGVVSGIALVLYALWYFTGNLDLFFF